MFPSLTIASNVLLSALEALLANPEKAFLDFTRISRAFLMPEQVTLSDAAAIVKKPRLGAAIYSFKRTVWKAPQQPEPTSEAPPSKRQRTTQPVEQGGCVHIEQCYPLHTMFG